MNKSYKNNNNNILHAIKETSIVYHKYCDDIYDNYELRKELYI